MFDDDFKIALITGSPVLRGSGLGSGSGSGSVSGSG